MITPEIIGYIKTEREKSTPDATIHSNLLANGWNGVDIAEAFSVFSSGSISTVPKPNMTNAQLTKHREKVKWNTFAVLLIIDILIIVFYKVSYGVYGVFGLSFISVIVRLLVIFFIAMYSAREATVSQSTGEAVAKGIGKVIGTVVVTIVVLAGVFFAGCLFIMAGFGR